MVKKGCFVNNDDYDDDDDDDDEIGKYTYVCAYHGGREV
jgi:hypothetical protein